MVNVPPVGCTEVELLQLVIMTLKRKIETPIITLRSDFLPRGNNPKNKEKLRQGVRTHIWIKDPSAPCFCPKDSNPEVNMVRVEVAFGAVAVGATVAGEN